MKVHFTRPTENYGHSKTQRNANFKSFASITLNRLWLFEANQEYNYCTVLALVTSTILPNFKSIGLVDQRSCYFPQSYAVCGLFQSSLKELSVLAAARTCLVFV